MTYFNAPYCDRCWQREHPTRLPIRIATAYRVTEQCFRCGQSTRSGIYVRTRETL